jgi:hypothetical protein
MEVFNKPLVSWTLMLLTLASSGDAYVNGQFRDPYSDEPWNRQDFFGALKTNCSEQYNKTMANHRIGGYDLISCLIDYIPEGVKLQMSIVSVIFGLLPMALQLVGPKVGDVSILAVHRPVLTVLACIGAPTVTLSHEDTGFEPSATKTGHSEKLWPQPLKRPAWWIRAMISVIEYVLVTGAAVNAVNQAYNLTFSAVVFISTLLGTFGGTLEAFSPLLWNFFPLIIHGFGVSALLLCSKRVEEAMDISENSSLEKWKSISFTSVLERMKRVALGELTPCAFATDLNPRLAWPEFEPGYVLLFLNWAVKIGSYVHILFGTIILSSVIFVPLWDTIEVVGRFLGGALLCRIVVGFEMYGLQIAKGKL